MDVVEAFKDPKTDFHQQIADMAEINRKTAKTINLGLSYGMGITKLAGELSMELSDAKQLFNNLQLDVSEIEDKLQWKPKYKIEEAIRLSLV